MKEAPRPRCVAAGNGHWRKDPAFFGSLTKESRLREPYRVCQSCPDFELELPASEMRVLAKSTLSLVPGQSGNPRVPFNPRAKCLCKLPTTQRLETQALRHSSPLDTAEVLTREHLPPRQLYLSVLRTSVPTEGAHARSRGAGVEVRAQGLDERGHRVPAL